jgi:putative RNA-binding protein, YhbY family
MITSKQRAYLRGLANSLDPIFQLGKGGINENFIRQIDEALEKRELIKVHILETALLETKITCSKIAEQVGAEPVQAIGSKFVLYRESEDHKTIDLPK